MDHNPYASSSVASNANDISRHRRGPSRWRAVLGGLLVLYPGIGLIGAQVGLLGLLGILPLSGEYPNWGEYVFSTLLFSMFVAIGCYFLLSSRRSCERANWQR